MVSCVPKSPDDKLDRNTTLRTADGRPMQTYGKKKVTVQLGRKAYTIEAIVTDVSQRILGMDFLINTD